MARGKFSFVALILVIVAIVLTSTSGATTYFVGDATGWMVTSGGAATYAAWAALHNFTAGDVLVFNFTTGVHSAAKVTSNDFVNCNVNSPISIQTNGPANYTLDFSPQQFYICTFSNHCSRGQKLQINLISSSNTTSPPPGSSPNAATPPPPPPPQPPPPGSSASRAAAGTFSLIFLYIAMTNF